MRAGLRVGVLALQGAVGLHAEAMQALGAETVTVKRPDDLDGIDGLVLPGGESTTMSMLLESSGLFDPIAELLGKGMPAFGTCAGMILLATEVLDGRADQRSFGAIEMVVRRNAYGRQVDSFETPIEVSGLTDAFPGVFIRAPQVEKVGPDVEVLATLPDDPSHPVLCRWGGIMVASFHPELAGDPRIHELFLKEL